MAFIREMFGESRLLAGKNWDLNPQTHLNGFGDLNLNPQTHLRTKGMLGVIEKNCGMVARGYQEKNCEFHVGWQWPLIQPLYEASVVPACYLSLQAQGIPALLFSTHSDLGLAKALVCNGRLGPPVGSVWDRACSLCSVWDLCGGDWDGTDKL